MEQVKDLVSQTLERIYSRENFQSYQRRDDPIRNKVAEVIIRLGFNYGHLFSSFYKTEEMLEGMITEWAFDIGKYSYEKLDEAIARCKLNHERSVTLSQFMACLKVSQQQALSEGRYSDGPLYLTKLETPEEKSVRRERGMIELNKIRDLLK